MACPGHASKDILFSHLDSLDITTSRKVFHERNKKIIDAFNSIEHNNLIRIFPEEFLCKKDRCLVNDSENIFYFDDDHLSNQGNKLFSDHIAQRIDSLL